MTGSEGRSRLPEQFLRSGQDLRRYDCDRAATVLREGGEIGRAWRDFAAWATRVGSRRQRADLRAWLPAVVAVAAFASVTAGAELPGRVAVGLAVAAATALGTWLAVNVWGRSRGFPYRLREVDRFWDDDVDADPRPAGSIAADLRFYRLHPWVDRAVDPLWRGRHYPQAVEQAAKSITAHTQRKLGRRDLADDKLLQQAFSDQRPESGKPRLRFPGDPDTDSGRNRRRGAQKLSEACFAGIRNLAAHEYELGWSREQCLEYLVAFSILARWINECEKIDADDNAH